MRVIRAASIKISLRRKCQPVFSLFASSRRFRNAMTTSTVVKSALRIMIRAYEVAQASEKSNLAHAFATPLATTAIAAHRARWLNRGSATMRSASDRSAMAKTPPTHRASEITCTTSEPTASACEPEDAEWL